MLKLGLAFSVLACACGTTNSDSLLTSGMSAEISVWGSSDGTTTVEAELYSGDPDQLIFVKLDDGDQLVATTASQSLPLVEDQIAPFVEYDAQFLTNTDGAQFTVDLERSLDSGAPSSTVSLPAPFTLAAVSTSASRAAELAIAWSPASATDPMTWQIDGSCIETAGGTVTGDPGSQTVAANTLVKAAGNGVADSCTATLTLTRSRDGVLDPHFGHGGSIVAQQVRTATFTTTP